MRKLLILFFFLSIGQITIGQNNLSSNNKKALKLFTEASKAKSDRDFDKAIQCLEKAIGIDPYFAEAHQELGTYYKILRDGVKSKQHFEDALKAKANSPNLLLTYIEIANFRLSEGKYQEARDLCKRYQSFNPSARYFQLTQQAKGIIATADFAIEGMKTPVDFKPITLSDSVNQLEYQFFPVLTADQRTLIFTGITEAKDEDIFECIKLENGEWSSPKPIKELNTPFNEGTCSISADGKTIIFTSCEGAGNKRQIYGSCDLFISKKVGGVWSPPRNIGSSINSKHWESQPALSSDGKELYFTSDRPGGKGGRDIWVTKLDDNNKWSRPENMSVNSAGNEFSPFIHVNNKSLFFASDGYTGYGRLDLYRADLDSTNNWGEPSNLGYPINNGGDQVALFITADGQKGYYSDGIIKDGKRDKDVLIMFDIPKEIQIEKASDVVKGVVYDAKTKKKLGAKIALIDIASETTVSTANSDIQDGDYLITLASGAEYALYVNREGYLFKSLAFNYKEKKEAQTIELDIYLDPIEKGSKVTLNNIFFASGSYDLEDKSKTELNKLVKFMQENKSTKIEIGAHTDDVGSTDSNQKLSLKRADAVMKYLSDNGIETGRVVSFGYGETQPVAKNDTDEGKATNRRIEFKVL